MIIDIIAKKMVNFMGYSITSESQLIDVETIRNGCTIIENAANSFEDCAKKVEGAADICNINALSVDKSTMQPVMYELADEIKKVKKYIIDFADSIEEISQEILASQRRELQAYYDSLNNKKGEEEGQESDE